jgi:hypothetical protein
MDIRQVVAAVEAEVGVKVRLHRIPREIMERNRTEVPRHFSACVHPGTRMRAKGLRRDPLSSFQKKGSMYVICGGRLSSDSRVSAVFTLVKGADVPKQGCK